MKSFLQKYLLRQENSANAFKDGKLNNVVQIKNHAIYNSNNNLEANNMM